MKVTIVSDSSSGRARISSSVNVTSSLMRAMIDLVDLFADGFGGEDGRSGGQLFGNPSERVLGEGRR